MRKTTVIAAVGTVVLIGAVAGVRFVALPALRQVPADLDTTVHLTGTADLLDASALASGDLTRAMRNDVPVSVRERIRTTATDGHTAVIEDETTMTGPDQAVVSTSKHSWSVNRTTLDAAPASAAAAARHEEPHAGLVVGFPLSPQPHDYPYWDTPTGSTVTARFQRAERHADRDTYVYDVHASGALTDPTLLATLPDTLSKQALLGISTSLPQAQRDLVTSVSALLPAQIPLAYSATSDTTFWIDTATGYVIDLHRTQTVAAGSGGAFSGFNLPTTFTVELRYTAGSVTEAHDGAVRAQRGLNLLGTVTPLALSGLAVLLAIVAAFSALRRRPAGAVAPGSMAEPGGTDQIGQRP